MKKVDLTQFDPIKVGRLDSDMWRSYYNHQFHKLFWQLCRLLKTQLGLSWPVTLRLAYYSAWAAADYRLRKRKGVNNDRVLSNLTKFYGLISRRSTTTFDCKKAAELELKWWDVHRKSTHNNEALERSLAEGAAVIYGVPPAKLSHYAHCRAEAMILPRHEGDAQVVPTDWQKVTELLEEAWGSLHAAVKKANKGRTRRVSRGLEVRPRTE